MPVTVEAPQTGAVLPHKLWTREECAVLQNAGLIHYEDYELIEGELIRKMSKNPPHSRALRLLVGWLEDVFGRNFILPESSIDLRPEDTPTSEPEPDAFVLTIPYLELDPKARARPAQIRLIAEVSDSRLAFDLTAKARLYARATIPEYWVLDIEGRRMIVHRDPVDSRYQSVYGYREDERVSPLAAPAAEVRVSDFFK